MDWTWARTETGRYELTYLKYAEEANDSFSTIQEWTKEDIHAYTVDHRINQCRITQLPQMA